MLRTKFLLQGRVYSQIGHAHVLTDVNSVNDAVHRIRAVDQALASSALKRVIVRTRRCANEIVGIVVVHKVIRTRRDTLAFEDIGLVASARLKLCYTELCVLNLFARGLIDLGKVLVSRSLFNARSSYFVVACAFVLANLSRRVVVLVLVALLHAQQLPVVLALQEVRTLVSAVEQRAALNRVLGTVHGASAV